VGTTLRQPNVMAIGGERAFVLASLPYSVAVARAIVCVQPSKTRPGRRMAVADPQQANSDDARRSAWMAAAQAGDSAAYERLLRDCVPLIKAVARRQGVLGDRADDVVQDVLLTIHRARQTYDPARSFTAWLRVIAERRAIDLLRQTGRQGAREIHAPLAFEGHADASADPSIGLDRADDAGQISQALAGLPARQREAVQYLVLEEQSLADAAALTRRSKGSLKVNLHRALKALRGRIGREE
jgi:RNA polymerase sigma-70 factor (ECF subfamily)